MFGKLRIWEIPNINNDKITVWIESIYLDKEGLSITFEKSGLEGGRYTLNFEYFISYRVSNENILLEIWHETNPELLGFVFYIVENSRYINELEKLSYGINQNLSNKFTHYAIYTFEECIEIITDCEPKFIKFAAGAGLSNWPTGPTGAGL